MWPAHACLSASLLWTYFACFRRGAIINNVSLNFLCELLCEHAIVSLGEVGSTWHNWFVKSKGLFLPQSLKVPLWAWLASQFGPVWDSGHGRSCSRAKLLASAPWTKKEDATKGRVILSKGMLSHQWLPTAPPPQGTTTSQLGYPVIKHLTCGSLWGTIIQTITAPTVVQLPYINCVRIYLPLYSQTLLD